MTICTHNNRVFSADSSRNGPRRFSRSLGRTQSIRVELWPHHRRRRKGDLFKNCLNNINIRGAFSKTLEVLYKSSSRFDVDVSKKASTVTTTYVFIGFLYDDGQSVPEREKIQVINIV